MSWKELSVVFKPLTYNPFIGDFILSKVDGFDDYDCGIKTQEPYNCSATYYGIYVCSSEPLKKDDWYYSTITGDICRAASDGGEPLTDKKIVATSDKSLAVLSGYDEVSSMPIYSRLPEIPIEWLIHYISKKNEGVNIRTASVEYETLGRYGNVLMAKSPLNNESNSDMSIYEDYLKINHGFIRIDFDKEIKNEIPLDAIQNIIGYVDTPIGRRKYPTEVVESVQKLKKWIENIKLN